MTDNFTKSNLWNDRLIKDGKHLSIVYEGLFLSDRAKVINIDDNNDDNMFYL